jgi:hypothetical protein
MSSLTPSFRVFNDRVFMPVFKEQSMAALKPGSSTGPNGGIFQQVGPQGGKQPNFATVADWKPLPPTTKPGHGWVPVKTTPCSKR